MKAWSIRPSSGQAQMHLEFDGYRPRARISPSLSTRRVHPLSSTVHARRPRPRPRPRRRSRPRRRRCPRPRRHRPRPSVSVSLCLSAIGYTGARLVLPSWARLLPVLPELSYRVCVYVYACTRPLPTPDAVPRTLYSPHRTHLVPIHPRSQIARPCSPSLPTASSMSTYGPSK